MRLLLLTAFVALLASAWFARAVDWQAGRGERHAALSVAPGGSNGWRRVDPRLSGIVFTNAIAVERFTTNQIYLNGSGVCAGDIDGDGWTDLFFAGLGGHSTLYRNRGNWKFEDVTGAAGVRAFTQGLDATGAVFADIDGDGDLDLVVNSVGGGTHVALNDGRGGFRPMASLNAGRGGTSLALADLDGDGSLDLYVANYRTVTLRDQPRTNFRIERTNGQFVVALVNGRPATLPEYEGRFTYLASGSILENGEPDAVFHNDGTGRFTPIPMNGGTFLDETGNPLPAPLYDWGLSVLLRDLNGDGLPDIYVCNDFNTPDRFWINQGGGRFRAASAEVLRNSSKFSMGVDAADIDRDGHDDLYVLDMMSRSHAIRLTRMDTTMDGTSIGDLTTRPQFARSTLQHARGDGTFAEIAQFAGLEATEWSWAPVFVDVDLDGFEDLLIATGHARDDMHLDYGTRIEAMRKSTRMTVQDELNLRRNTPSFPFRCLAFRNRGDLHFDEVPNGWGCGESETISQGTCLADLDNDGDLDVAINRMNGVAGVYENTGSAPRVLVRLKGLPPNTRGIGARLEVSGGPLPRQSQEMLCGGRYLSADDAVRVFAAGALTNRLRLEVRWRSGRRSVVEDLQPNTAYEIDEAAASPVAASTPPAETPPLFVDQSARLGHRHFDSEFDDFERQPLLARRGSQAGPGVGWIDVDGDGREDLFVASGRGGRPGLFLNAGGGGFRVIEPSPATLDQVGVIGWPRGATSAVLVASSAYEGVGAASAGVRAYDAGGTASDILPLGSDSIGPLALADRNGDGELTLFVGGTAVGGRYPEASPSRLFVQRDGRWVPDAAGKAALAGAGIVTGAVWSDLDGDGHPELVLVGEWGPPRVFRSDAKGALREVTRDLGLDRFSGWWTGVNAGDFDGDGRLDLVVGNWGLNSRYRPTHGHPVRVYYGDLAGQGQVELVESSFEPALGKWVPERDLRVLSRALPWLSAKFPRHQDFATAGIDDLFAGREITPRILDAAVLSSTVFLNRGDHFEAVPLPAEAQLAPASGVAVADFDLDGVPDLFLAQNFFPVGRAISRQDAGRGLLLVGEGNGRFRAVDGALSGLAIYGDQRGCAVADYDGDGRPDLVVAQNGGATRLFRQAAAKPGLEVRLRGTPGNPHAVGAVVRWQGASGPAGPAHEIHGGSGWGSQDAPAVWLPRPTAAGTLEVRWPGGRVTRHSVPGDPNRSRIVLELPPATP